MKPIEPNCLCLSLDSQWPGQVIARYSVAAGTVFPTPDGGRFKTLADGWSCEVPGKPFPAMIATRHLVRIDGDAESEERIAESQEVPA